LVYFVVFIAGAAFIDVLDVCIIVINIIDVIIDVIIDAIIDVIIVINLIDIILVIYIYFDITIIQALFFLLIKGLMFAAAHLRAARHIEDELLEGEFRLAVDRFLLDEDLSDLVQHLAAVSSSSLHRLAVLRQWRRAVAEPVED
jgi:hypothetical protein